MMRQLSCKDLDSAYREVSKIANSMLMRSDAPEWIYGDVKDAVFDRRYPKAVQGFIWTILSVQRKKDIRDRN
jgi:hypothetical protein